jgi:hypothetical protein
VPEYLTFDSLAPTRGFLQRGPMADASLEAQLSTLRSQKGELEALLASGALTDDQVSTFTALTVSYGVPRHRLACH